MGDPAPVRVAYEDSELGTARRAALERLERRFGRVWNIHHDAQGWHFSRRDGEGGWGELHAPDETQAAVLMSGQETARDLTRGGVAEPDGFARHQLAPAAGRVPLR